MLFMEKKFKMEMSLFFVAPDNKKENTVKLLGWFKLIIGSEGVCH